MTDWYESETPMRWLLVAELRRLKRRAQARWPLVLAIAALLTAAVVWKVARKPAMYRARVVLAITEGEMISGRDATPLGEVRDYIGSVLLSNAEILKLLEKERLFVSQRRTFGDDFAIASFRDMIGIGVWRNYFQYTYSYDERRTARVAIVFTHADRDFAYEMAHQLASIVIAREGDRRAQAAGELLEQSREVLDAARARLTAVQAEHHLAVVDLERAEAGGDATLTAVRRVRVADLAAAEARAEEQFFSIEQITTTEALQAAATAAGMALEIAVVDERKPPLNERPLVSLISVGLFAMCIFLPLAGIVIGTFDARVHDLEDISRLDLAPLGHLPGFPGDRVGALRDRGVPRRRMPSWVPWR